MSEDLTHEWFIFKANGCRPSEVMIRKREVVCLEHSPSDDLTRVMVSGDRGWGCDDPEGKEYARLSALLLRGPR